MSSKIVILGAGESGVGAAILAKQKGYDVWVSDSGEISTDHKAELIDRNIKFEEGGHNIDRFKGVDLVVKSPGIPDNIELIFNLRAQQVEIVSEIEFAFRFIEKAKLIAITGTNGKTTTTLLTDHLLKTAGLDVAMGGNVGVSLARLIAERSYDYYVVEVSSFQLDGIVTFKPDIAILLNITPDHLDRYNNNFENYISSKFKISENLTKEECFIYCADSQPVTEELSKRRIEACLFAISTSNKNKPDGYLYQDHLIFDFDYKKQELHHEIPISNINLIGKHNMVNTMAAVLTALTLEISIEKILEGLKTFKNISHRLENAGEINGVRFINDSKATNVDAVFYALEGISGNIIWIAGGIDKGNDYSRLEELVRQKVNALICLGVDNSPILNFFGSRIKNIYETQLLNVAVEKAQRLAKPGDTVLLSPACASFDLFRNYEDRGDQFKNAVRELKNGQVAKV